MSETFGFINLPSSPQQKPVRYLVANSLVDIFTKRGICDLIWWFISEHEGREIKTISAYSCHSDIPGCEAFYHPSMKPEDNDKFIQVLEARKAAMLARFPTEVLEAKLTKRTT